MTDFDEAFPPGRSKCIAPCFPPKLGFPPWNVSRYIDIGACLFTSFWQKPIRLDDPLEYKNNRHGLRFSSST